MLWRRASSAASCREAISKARCRWLGVNCHPLRPLADASYPSLRLRDGSNMAPRHRIPTIFNLSMVDVLCCALGCVILLWLLNLREAKQRAVAAGQADEQVLALRRDLEAARAYLADVTGKYAAAQEQLSESERRAA